MEEHRPALRFDFRHFFSLSLADVGHSIRFGEAVDLVDQLHLEMGSHLNASIGKWGWAATWGEMIAARHAEWYINAHREEGTPVVELPMPWPKTPVEEDVTDEERETLRASLRARSAFRE